MGRSVRSRGEFEPWHDGVWPRSVSILPDPKFHDTLVTKFINVLMLCGKKSTAEHIFYGALDLVAERSKQDPLSDFQACHGQRKAGARGEISAGRWINVSGTR